MLKIDRPPPTWILGSPRVGSSYYISLLNSTEIFRPQFVEHFHNSMWDEKWLRFSPRYNKVHAGVFHRRVCDVDLEEKLPGIKYILLRRKDCVASAVSHYFSKKLNQFTVSAKDRDMVKTHEVEYDEDSILKLYHFHRKSHVGWDEYLSTREYLEFDYEDLVDDPRGVVGRTLNYLGVSGEANLNDPQIQIKLRHPQKEEFIRRIRALIE